jgi:lysyl-tRNA synthetase class 2
MPSSVIRRFAYDASRRVLDIEFVSGRRYRYRAVPPPVAEAFQGAASKGRFFNARIRDNFAFVELKADRRHG